MSSFKDYVKEVETMSIFPSDEEIAKIANSADESFWRVVYEAFKDKLDTKEFTPSEQMENFKTQQQNAIKEWLKENWPKPDDSNKNKPKVTEFKGGTVKFEEPVKSSGAGSEPSTGTATTSTPEARI